MDKMNSKSTKTFLVIMFATMYSSHSFIRRRSGALRVKSGRDVSPGELPFVVRIELYVTINNIINTNETTHLYYHKCTGSVLTQTATLTAGHCCNADLEKLSIEHKGFAVKAKYVVRYGSTPGKPDDQSDKFSVVLKKTRPPAGWGSEHPLFTDDLAILTTEPILLPSYGKISSLDYPSVIGLQVIVAGYGATSYNSSETDTLTLDLPLQVIDGILIECPDDKNLGKKFPLLCTQSACGNQLGLIGPGDSGGPVVHYSGIVGVNLISLYSFLRRFDPEYTPVYFQAQVMSLSPYINWLTRTLQQNNQHG